MKTLSNTFLLLFIGLPIFLSAQEFATHWVPLNPGARSSSMGRANVMDNGSSSVFHNPAALGDFEYLTISAFASLNSLSQISGHLEALDNNGDVQTTSMKSPLNLVVIYPAPELEYDYIKMTYGVGYSRYFQWVNEHSWSFQLDGMESTRSLDGSSGVDVFHLGAGIKIWDRISIGMTANYVLGKDYFSKDVLYADGEYADGFAQTFTTSNTMFWKTGILATITTSLNVGLSITTPLSISK